MLTFNKKCPRCHNEAICYTEDGRNRLFCPACGNNQLLIETYESTKKTTPRNDNSANV